MPEIRLGKARRGYEGYVYEPPKSNYEAAAEEFYRGIEEAWANSVQTPNPFHSRLRRLLSGDVDEADSAAFDAGLCSNLVDL